MPCKTNVDLNPKHGGKTSGKEIEVVYYQRRVYGKVVCITFAIFKHHAAKQAKDNHFVVNSPVCMDFR